MGLSERQRELRRRRSRKKKLNHIKSRLAKASVSEKNVLAERIRRITPGADVIIERLSLEER